jgi:hypothetical protein
MFFSLMSFTILFFRKKETKNSLREQSESLERERTYATRLRQGFGGHKALVNKAGV